MKTKTGYILFIGLIFSFNIIPVMNKCYAQTLPHFSLYPLHRPLVNTGARAEAEEIQGCIFYKSQWVGFEGAPKIMVFDVNVPVAKFKSVFGMTFVDDQIGVNKNQNIIANYAYRLQLQKSHYLGFGLSFNARLFQSALSKVETESGQSGTIDPQFQNNSPTIFAPNFVFGAYYYSNSVFAGLAVPNLLVNAMVGKNGNIYDVTTDFSPGKNHFYLHGGWKKDVGKYLYFEPSLLMKFISGSPLQIDVNTRILYRDVIGAGLSYRTLNTIAAMLNYRMNAYINLAYAFSHNFSELSQYGSNSHEITLVYAIGAGKKFKIDVPRF